MKEKPEEKQNRIIGELAAVRSAILDAVADLPAENQKQIFLGIWSIEDLLAHLIGWDYANLQAIGELQSGQIPGFYAYSGKDWSKFNAMLVKRYKCENFSDLLASIKESHQKLLAAASQVPPLDFDQNWQVRHKGFKVTISRLLKAEAGDERTHLEQIRSFLER